MKLRSDTKRGSSRPPVPLPAIQISGLAPEPDGRAREPITRSDLGYRVKFPSQKLRRPVYCESWLERCVVLGLEYDPAVICYQEQPCVVHFYDEKGRVREAYPDLLVRRSETDWTFLEVKPKAKLQRPKVRAHLEAVALRMKELGHPYRIVTEDQAQREPRLGNLERIHDAVRTCKAVGAETPRDLPAGIQKTLSFGELMRMLQGERDVFLHYLAGRLRFDIDEELCDSALVEIL